jgi:hypothetical protein
MSQALGTTCNMGIIAFGYQMIKEDEKAILLTTFQIRTFST